MVILVAYFIYFILRQSHDPMIATLKLQNMFHSICHDLMNIQTSPFGYHTWPTSPMNLN